MLVPCPLSDSILRLIRPYRFFQERHWHHIRVCPSPCKVSAYNKCNIITVYMFANDDWIKISFDQVGHLSFACVRWKMTKTCRMDSNGSRWPEMRKQNAGQIRQSAKNMTYQSRTWCINRWLWSCLLHSNVLQLLPKIWQWSYWLSMFCNTYAQKL